MGHAPIIALVLSALFLTTFILYDSSAKSNTSIVSSSSSSHTIRYGPDPRILDIYKPWKECFLEVVKPFKDDKLAKEFWDNILKAIPKCADLPGMKKLRLEPFTNHDETKYHILPIEFPQVPSVILTLGVGQDTFAEEMLKPRLPNGSEFYGADPVNLKVNSEKFNKFGTFFPFAVSAEAGMLKASVLVAETGNYIDQVVVNVDIIYLMKKIIKRDFYDTIWMDAEYAEYGLFPFFYAGGKFDQNNITICQFNMEVHSPTLAQKVLFQSFIFQLLSDATYSVLRVVAVGHHRLYFVNVRDSRCVDKYLMLDKPTSNNVPGR